MSADDDRALVDLRYAGSWLPEDEALTTARLRARELGVATLDVTACAALRLLAATAGARTAVEVGAGAGVAGTWLLDGMAGDGQLTCVDSDGEGQRVARETYAAVGVPASRVRLITGQPDEVLPRLADGAYDIALCHDRPTRLADRLAECRRLLRPGGVVVLSGVLGEVRTADQSARDDDVLAVRDLLKVVREDDTLVPTLLPFGSGLLAVATRRD